jgi:hypothetical protein
MIVSLNHQPPRFYDKDGSPVFEVTAKNGNPRTPTIADAKKNGWKPSVTTILKVLDKPILTTWKIEQAILSALTLQREAGESDTAFAERIAKDSQEEGRQAADLGSEIHKAIEMYLATGIFADAYKKYLVSFESYLATLEGKPESEVFANGNGYAGRADLLITGKDGITVLDYKTQKFKDGKATFYEEWGMQLAAYGKALNANKIVSVVIDRETGEIKSKEWDMETEWKKFSLLKDYYLLAKGFV